MKMDWSILVSIIALCFSIAAIIVVYPRVTLGIDYLGLIVGMLSFLITLLMGWNIYTLVDFKNKIKDIENVKSDFRKIFEINKATYLTHVADLEESISILYGLKLGQYKDKDVEIEWIANLISASLHYAKIGDIGKAEVLIHESNEAIKHVDGQKIDRRRCFLLAHLLENHKELNLNGADLLVNALIQIH